jgi:ADP-glucose pyrophosphorylase
MEVVVVREGSTVGGTLLVEDFPISVMSMEEEEILCVMAREVTVDKGVEMEAVMVQEVVKVEEEVEVEEAVEEEAVEVDEVNVVGAGAGAAVIGMGISFDLQ